MKFYQVLLPLAAQLPILQPNDEAAVSIQEEWPLHIDKQTRIYAQSGQP